jgi:hypothetical protein
MGRGDCQRDRDEGASAEHILASKSTELVSQRIWM